MFTKSVIEYNRILSKTSKEFVVVIKRTMKFEKLEVIEAVVTDHRQGADVALITADRLLILRGYKGIKTAHIQEFQLDTWKDYRGGGGSQSITAFLKHYDETVQKLEDQWMKAM